MQRCRFGLCLSQISQIVFSPVKPSYIYYCFPPTYPVSEGSLLFHLTARNIWSKRQNLVGRTILQNVLSMGQSSTLTFFTPIKRKLVLSIALLCNKVKAEASVSMQCLSLTTRLLILAYKLQGISRIFQFIPVTDPSHSRGEVNFTAIAVKNLQRNATLTKWGLEIELVRSLVHFLSLPNDKQQGLQPGGKFFPLVSKACY